MAKRTKNKQRVVIAIDGSNFYNRLKEKPLSVKNLMQFDYKGFINFLCRGGKLVQATYYVGVIRTQKGNKKSYQLFRNQIRLFGILTRQGITVSRGYILKTNGYREKGVDVQIAVDMLIGAYENLYDKIVLLSSDTDLLPAIDKTVSLGKEIEYIGFSHNPSYALINRSTTPRLLTRSDLLPFCK